MEMMRLPILYIHLMACCVALGLTLISDATFLKRLVTGMPVDRRSADIDNLQSTVMKSLIMLWITGIGIIFTDVVVNGLHIFANPKLQAKIAMCVILTLNGIVLHHRVLPAMQKAGSILRLDEVMLKLAVLTGAISAISWLSAAFFGIARPLSWKYSLGELLFAYPILILLAYLFIHGTVTWAKRRRDPVLGEVAEARM